MRLGNHVAIVVVGAEARVDFVVVGSGITVIRAAGHIVFEHRSEPNCSNSEGVDISEMLCNTLDITAMTSVGILAVGFHRMVEGSVIVVGSVAVGKSVGHKEIEEVGARERGVLLCATRPKFVFDSGFLLAVYQSDWELAGHGIATDIKVEQEIIRAVEAHHAIEAHAFTIDFGQRIAHAVAVDHHLHGFVFHTCPPESRFSDRRIFGTER